MICIPAIFEMASYPSRKEKMTDAMTAMAHKEFEMNAKARSQGEYVDEAMTVRANELGKVERRLENRKEELLYHIRELMHDKKVEGSERIIEAYIETIAEIDSKLNVIRVNRYFLVET